MPTIFDSVVTKENDHTNLLRNLMDRDPKAASIILTCLTGEEISEIDAAKFIYRTQRSFEGPDGREIPDIVVDGDGLQYLIEVKIDPELGLTPRQREGYAGCFAKDREQKYLCFLVPNDWKHSEDMRRVENALHATNVRTRLCRWQSLISEIDECIAQTQNRELLKEALSFWKWRFEICPMTPEEREFMKTWSGEKYRAIRKLEKAIDQTKKLFDARGHKTELETDVTAYGFYIKRDDLYLLWVGIWDMASTPLSYGYELGPHWLKPSSIPPGGITVAKYHLWDLQPETWDSPERVYTLVASFLDACFSK